MWKYLTIIVLMWGATACDDGMAKNKTNEATPIDAKSNNTDTVNDEIGGLIDDYYSMKDNFVAENELLVNKYAAAMEQAADTLDLNTVKTTAVDKEKNKQLVEEINADLKGLVAEKDIEAKRKPFRAVSDKLYELIKAIQYDKQIIYHEHCPMAFNQTGADWLSNTTDIKNPYIPTKMLDCGEVHDTIDFTKP